MNVCLVPCARLETNRVAGPVVPPLSKYQLEATSSGPEHLNSPLVVDVRVDEQRHIASPLGGKVGYLRRCRDSSSGDVQDALRDVEVSVAAAADPVHPDESRAELILLRFEQRPDSRVAAWRVRRESDQVRWYLSDQCGHADNLRLRQRLASCSIALLIRCL